MGLERTVWRAFETKSSLGMHPTMTDIPTHILFCKVILEDIDLLFPRYADAQDNGLCLVLDRCLRQLSSHQVLLVGTTRHLRSLDQNVKSLFQVTRIRSMGVNGNGNPLSS